MTRDPCTTGCDVWSGAMRALRDICVEAGYRMVRTTLHYLCNQPQWLSWGCGIESFNQIGRLALRYLP